MKWPKIRGRSAHSETKSSAGDRPKRRMFRNLNADAIGIDLPFLELLPLAAEYGFQSVELPIKDFVDASPEKIQAAKKALVDSGLRAAGYPLPVEFRKDNDLFKEGLSNLDKAAAIAAEFGCIRCYTWVLPYHEELTFPENFEIHRDRLGDCARVLDKHGARLGLEYVAPASLRKSGSFEFIHDLRGIIELIKLIDVPNLGLLLDSFHWYTSGGTEEDLLALKSEQIVYVHINDAPAGLPVEEQQDLRRCLPGETGVIDLETFLSALDQIGYAGPVAIQPFLEEFQRMDPRDVLSKLQESFDRVNL